MSAPKLNPLLKLALELGPLALFFIVYAKAGIFVATSVMMVTVLATLIVSWIKLGRLPLMPLVTATIVVVFGSLGLLFHNETLIKIKPTALYLMFAGALFFGLIAKRPILRIMFDGALNLDEEGWRRLTWRWACFFLFLAVLNEAIWRTQTTDVWVTFKSFGFLPLTLGFALAQTRLIMKHESRENAPEEAL